MDSRYRHVIYHIDVI